MITLQRLIALGVFGVLGLTIGGCENPDGTKLQYMPDMADGHKLKSQLEYLDPPVGSVPTNAIIYANSPEEAEILHVNPFKGAPNEAEHAQKGKVLWDTYCIVCHGADAKGEGYISDKYPPPPDLIQDIFRDKKDGHFFYKITFGSMIMPSYGHAISSDERWDIVLYLRTLQKEGKPL